MSEKEFEVNILNNTKIIYIKEIVGYEITSTRLKNHILGLFENVKYNELSLYIEINDKESELEDEEILDEDYIINCYL